MAPKKSRFADEIGERCGEIEYRGGKVLQRWRSSGGNVRLSHLLMSFLLTVLVASTLCNSAYHIHYHIGAATAGSVVSRLSLLVCDFVTTCVTLFVISG